MSQSPDQQESQQILNTDGEKVLSILSIMGDRLFLPDVANEFFKDARHTVVQRSLSESPWIALTEAANPSSFVHGISLQREASLGLSPERTIRARTIGPYLLLFGSVKKIAYPGEFACLILPDRDSAKLGQVALYENGQGFATGRGERSLPPMSELEDFLKAKGLLKQSEQVSDLIS